MCNRNFYSATYQMKATIAADQQVGLKDGDSRMNADEIRLDLESFINRGLREGWRGWPVKRQKHIATEIRGLHANSPMLTGLSPALRMATFETRLDFGRLRLGGAENPCRN